MRPLPEWLITDELDYVERDLGRLKSGKEAEVFIVERTYQDRSCLLAHKRYRPRSVSQKGELEALGFQRSNAFMNDLAYRDGRRFAKSRDQRAAERMTKYGKKLLTGRWTGHELDMMQTRVACRRERSLSGRCSRRRAAHAVRRRRRTCRAAFGRGEARRERDPRRVGTARRESLLLVGAGFVHADLSAFNLLWWDGKVWLIDFPQAVDVTSNPHAFDYLHRDVTNVCTWFARHGEVIDAGELYAELIAIAGTG